MKARFHQLYELVSLLLVAVFGQLAVLIFGDCGGVYYYAAMAGLTVGWGVIGAVAAMRRIRDPLWLAHLAHQMQREAEDTGRIETIRDYYVQLHEVAVAEAERREPGVVRRAWEVRAKQCPTS